MSWYRIQYAHDECNAFWICEWSCACNDRCPVCDVEWNAKDGNLDRDLASYRSWFEAGVISAGVIITKDRVPLLNLAKKLWSAYQSTVPEGERSSRLPIDLATSTVTAFDKAQLRVRRAVMGSCPVLIVAANETTWNGKPYA